MNPSKFNHYDDDYDDMPEQEEPAFQRVKKQTGKPSTLKEDRRLASKEFGKRINKLHKQRRRYEGPGKP